MIKACAAALLAAALGGYADALEMPTLSPEELLCGEDAALVVHVTDARSHDCGRPIDGCYSHYVGITAQIDEVIRPSKGGVRIGGQIRAGLQVTKGPDTQGEWPNNPGYLDFPASDQVSDSVARSELVGKRLLLAVTPVGRSIFRSTSAKKFPAAVGEPYFAWAYMPDREDWVRSTWTSPYCASVRARVEGYRVKAHRTAEPVSGN